MNEHVVLGILWTVYCVLHSWLADMKVKQQAAGVLGGFFRFYRIFYTLFALAGFVAIILFQLGMNSPWLYRRIDALFFTGVLITMGGLVIMFVCIRKYFIQLSGIRSLYKKIPSNELQISGIHKYVRHPLYLGTFIFIWGLLLVIPVLSLLISNLIITIYTVIAIRFEEEKLMHEFGESYRRYRQKVPMLIPSPYNHL